MTQRASDMQVLVIKGRRVKFLLLARERSRGLLFREGFRDKAVTTKAKARISHSKMGGTSGLLASQGRECVSNATSLDTLDGIAPRGKDPRVMGHLSLSNQWEMHRHSLFLPTPSWAREDSISPKVLHKHLLFRRRATWAWAWAEVEDMAHMLAL